MKKLSLILTAVALVAIASVRAEDKPEHRRGPGAGRGASMMDQLLPPRAIEKLNLTADQKAKYDELCAAFKKDAEKWRADNPVTEEDKEAMKKAHESGDKEAMKKFAEKRKGLMEIRKGYVDKVKDMLTDEQKKQLDDMRGEMQKRAEHGHRAPGEKPAEK